MREGQHFLSEKIPKFPIPPPPQEKTYLPLIQKTLSMKWEGGFFFFGSHASKSGFSCVLSHFCLLLLMLIFKCCRYNLFIEPTDLKRKEKKKASLIFRNFFRNSAQLSSFPRLIPYVLFEVNVPNLNRQKSKSHISTDFSLRKTCFKVSFPTGYVIFWEW